MCPVAREPATGTQTRQALHRTEPAVSTPVLSLDIDAPPIYVDGGNLYITNFTETDAAVVRVIGEAEDRAAALHRILALGAHVSQVTTETASKLDLSNTIEQLTSSVEQTVDRAVEGITATAQGLLDGENGQLPRALAAVAREHHEMGAAGVAAPGSGRLPRTPAARERRKRERDEAGLPGGMREFHGGSGTLAESRRRRPKMSGAPDRSGAP